MGNSIRASAVSELKDPLSVLLNAPYGWSALHTALARAAQLISAGESELDLIALAAVHRATEVGFLSKTDERVTRFLEMPIMAFQDALYVVNELPEWRFPDEVLLVAWLVECGGPAMGRGPARAEFEKGSPDHYVGGSRGLFNGGNHGNGPGWPKSNQWPATACRYMSAVAVT